MKSEAGSSPDAKDAPLDPSSVQRVLLIRLRSIGDTVLMTPCLAALKAWHPNVAITVVSEPLAAPLLEDHSLVDELIITRPALSARASLVSHLRGGRFDIAFNLHGGSTGAILARMSGARRSVGYRGQPLTWLLSDRAPAPDVILGRSRIHSVEQQLALLNWAGVPWPEAPPRLSLVVSQEAGVRVREKLRAAGGRGENEFVDSGFACVVPGAALESKRWSAEGFAEVADHLSRRWNLPSVVVAGPGQEKLAREVASATRAQTRILAGLSLKELVALLAISRVFVGNDSGPMHIAAALEVPLVAVWGSSDPTVWRPWTEAPCRVVGERRTTDDGRRLAISQIAARDVIAAVDEVLKLALEANRESEVVWQTQPAKLEA